MLSQSTELIFATKTLVSQTSNYVRPYIGAVYYVNNFKVFRWCLLDHQRENLVSDEYCDCALKFCKKVSDREQRSLCNCCMRFLIESHVF